MTGTDALDLDLAQRSSLYPDYVYSKPNHPRRVHVTTLHWTLFQNNSLPGSISRYMDMLHVFLGKTSRSYVRSRSFPPSRCQLRNLYLIGVFRSRLLPSHVCVCSIELSASSLLTKWAASAALTYLDGFEVRQYLSVPLLSS